MSCISKGPPTGSPEPRPRRAAPLLLLLLAGLIGLDPVPASAQTGVILKQEVSQGLREPRAVRPGQVPAPERPTEHLLADMDVYRLSPSARRLALPRMVSPVFLARVAAGEAGRPAWDELAVRAGRTHGLSPALVAAVIAVESGHNPRAVSPVGAQGLMQIMPATQAELGLTDPFDPEANVTAGARYLRQQLDRFGSLELALAAYNAGPGNVEKYGGLPPFAETRAFVASVLAGMERRRDLDEIK